MVMYQLYAKAILNIPIVSHNKSWTTKSLEFVKYDSHLKQEHSINIKSDMAINCFDDYFKYTLEFDSHLV
jgi:hypothetical protein